MSTKSQYKRITKQIRVSEHLHRKIKFEAISQGKTISKFVDEIIEKHFTHKVSQGASSRETNKGR